MEAFMTEVLEFVEFVDFDNFHVKVSSESEPGKFHIVSRVAGVNHCSDCKGFRYWGYCHHFSDLFKDPILVPLRDRVNELLGKKPIKSAEVDIEGWKGESGIEIYESGDEFIVIEHRKRKSDGEIIQVRSRCKKDRVLGLWRLLVRMREDTRENEFKARDIFRELIITLDLGISMDAFNGGKNRSKIYMPLYYFPLKVLQEYYGAIEHLDKTVRLIKLTLPE
jgi:hypothetical protein